MGRPKQLLPLGGRPLLEGVVSAACDSSLDAVLVVLGARAHEIQAEVDLGRATVLVNPRHEEGMSSSLKAGLAALAPDVGRVVVMLGDQPAVTPGLIDGLLQLQASSGLPAAALSFGGLLHPPVVMERELWAEFDALEGDVGCRALIRARPELVATLPADGGHGHPVDVDTPDDYQRLISAGRV
jgi:CTP:molybdopterin cytidylyltransferase MocA